MEKYLKTTMSNEEMATDSEFEETEGTEEIKESSLLCRTFHPDEMFSKRTTPEYFARRIREIVAAYRPEWTPEDLRDRLTPELATEMGLWPLIKRLPCPDELNPKKDLYFIAWALYPKTRNIEEIDLVKRLFYEIVNGKRQFFPKKYFYGPKGLLRARMFFKLFMNRFAIPQFDLSCLTDAYEVFVSREIYRLIERCHLTAFVKEHFGIPLNFLQKCLDKDANDAAYYNTFFGKLKNPKRATFLLTSYEVSELHGGHLPMEYQEYFAYQEAQERKREEKRPKTRSIL